MSRHDAGLHWYHPHVHGRMARQMFAGLTGVGSWLFGYPYLTSTYAHVHWPVVGDFELASAMVFDVGVFLTVVGSSMLVLANLGRIELGASKEVERQRIGWSPSAAAAGAAAGGGGRRTTVVAAKAKEA